MLQEDGVARTVAHEKARAAVGGAASHRAGRWRAITMVLAILASIFAGLVVTGTAAQAAPAPSDERLGDQPTGWWTYHNVDATTLSNKLTENNARLADLRVNSASPLTFTATMVSASGPYGTGYWWYFGKTRYEVDKLLVDNQARPISLQKYYTSSGWRFAVVMVPNSGADYRPWKIAEGTPSAINSAVTAFGDARLAGLSVNVGDATFSSYTAIIVSNANGYAWWWWPSLTADEVGQVLTSTGGRLVDLDPHGDGRFSVIAYGMPSQYWWYYNKTGQQMMDLAGQHGARIIDMTPYNSGGSVRYAGVMVNNLTGLSAQLRDEMDGKVPGGSFGFRLQQVGGPVLAALQNGKQFEPASSIKALFHLHTLKARQNGQVSDTTSVTYRYNTDSSLAYSKDAWICPDTAPSTATSSLKNADEQMMWYSDNRMARAITDHFGYTVSPTPNVAPLSQTVNGLGLTATVFHHNDGCPTSATHNYTSLDDLAKVFDAGYAKMGAGAYLDATHRELFRTRMLSDANPGQAGTPADPNLHLCEMVDEEGAKLGLSTTTTSQFCQNIRYMTKGGQYHYGAGAEAGLGSVAAGRLIGLPVKSAGAINRVYYTYGDFVDDYVDDAANHNAVAALRDQVYRDAIRPQIAQALQTW